MTDQHRETAVALAYITDLEAELAAAREHLDDLIGAAIVAGEHPREIADALCAGPSAIETFPVVTASPS